MLALIRALEDWRHFLEGLDEPFEVWTDHKNMEWWAAMQNLNRRQARWSLYLARFNFVIKYIKGESNPADVLSRSAIAKKWEDSDDNRNVTVLKPHHFLTAAMVHFKPSSTSLSEHICKASQCKAEVIKELWSIDKHVPRALTDETML